MADKTLGAPQQCVGNPCNPANGNKFQTEVDSRDVSGSLSFVRHYNSQLGKNLGMGFGWTSRFGQRLEISASLVLRRNGDGRGEPFSCDATSCVGDSDSALKLGKDANGYTVTLADGTTERYDLNGRLLTETDRAGRITSYIYNASGQLERVTDPSGRSLGLTYDTSGRLSVLTTPDLKQLTYSYDVV